MASMFDLFSPGTTQPAKTGFIGPKINRMPKSTLKIDESGIRYESSVDKVQYVMRGLIAAANYDMAKLLIKRAREQAIKSPSIRAMSGIDPDKKKKNFVQPTRKPHQRGRSKGRKPGKYRQRFKNLFSYWVRKRDNDLLIGIKADTWYGVHAEMGTKGQPKRAILRNTVYQNIPDIMRIQAQYLSAIEDDIKANGIVVLTREEYFPDEDDEEGDDPE